MSHHAPIHFRCERDSESFGGAQCGNDELLRMTADCEGFERSGRYLADSADVGARFTSSRSGTIHVSVLRTLLLGEVRIAHRFGLWTTFIQRIPETAQQQARNTSN
jgi:hypothetical protein